MRYWSTDYYPSLVRNALQAAPCLYSLEWVRVGTPTTPNAHVRGMLKLRWDAIRLLLWFYNEMILPPQGTFVVLETWSTVITGEMLEASGEWRPEMQLNILQWAEKKPYNT